MDLLNWPSPLILSLGEHKLTLSVWAPRKEPAWLMTRRYTLLQLWSLDVWDEGSSVVPFWCVDCHSLVTLDGRNSLALWNFLLKARVPLMSLLFSRPNHCPEALPQHQSWHDLGGFLVDTQEWHKSSAHRSNLALILAVSLSSICSTVSVTQKNLSKCLLNTQILSVFMRDSGPPWVTSRMLRSSAPHLTRCLRQEDTSLWDIWFYFLGSRFHVLRL